MSNELDQKSLFERAFNLENEILTAQELLKELKAEYTYHAEENPQGLYKEDVASTLKAAKSYAKQVDLNEKIEELKGIDSLIEEFS